MRDKNNHYGWRYYEFRRATYGMQRDKKPGPSEDTVKEKILNDLRVAYRDKEKWQGWIKNSKLAQEWLVKNNLNRNLELP